MRGGPGHLVLDLEGVWRTRGLTVGMDGEGPTRGLGVACRRGEREAGRGTVADTSKVCL